jgi:hypothetical protein
LSIARFDEGRIPDVVHVQKEAFCYQNNIHFVDVKEMLEILPDSP